MKAIETKYKGYRFRSRLEARWAVFLDQLEISWEYEKEGFELSNGKRYLPDFWIPAPLYYDNDSGYFLEIKAAAPNKDEMDKCLALAKDTGHIVLLTYGSPTNEFFDKYSFYPKRENGAVVGVKEYHSRDTSPEMRNFFDLTGNDPSEQSFFAHFEIATKFWFGQKEDEFDHNKYEKAIISARAARFEYGESGV